ncbi:hypothetical protein GOBAR_AA17429 [Gossypium barbadense]|uniref:Uncharacterized protein n=1 Tax=Gossypium barbadense TaxID=3634 RepID=A0A2P5XIP0_GOSBA|nr:hypothetical protein GOBAR_AA17429 [Gossypium barbadense]
MVNIRTLPDLEKTSETDLFKAVTEAKALLNPLGFTLTEYTTYVYTSSAPGTMSYFGRLREKKASIAKNLT